MSYADMDPWIANSLMQKAIRRGESDVAQRAAGFFYSARGSAIWRRLIVIAFEDIGLGAIDEVIETVALSSSREKRQAGGGNEQAIARIVRRLSEAAKDRSADHIIASAANHPSLEDARRNVASRSLQGRLELLADKLVPIHERAIAAWYASGIELEQGRTSGGTLPALMGAYTELGAPDELVCATHEAARRSREPITVLLPLIWLCAQQSQRTIESAPVSAAASVDGIPLYTFDTHTRIGRRALDRLARTNFDIREILRQHAPFRSGIDAVRDAAFHAESAIVDRRLIWPGAAAIQKLGIETNLLAAGVDRGGHEALLDAVTRSIPKLNELRIEAYHEHLASTAVKSTANRLSISNINDVKERR